MNQADHEQLGLGSIKSSFMFAYLKISQAWTLVLGSFNKQVELKQKICSPTSSWVIRFDTKQFKCRLIYKFICVS